MKIAREPKKIWEATSEYLHDVDIGSCLIHVLQMSGYRRGEEDEGASSRLEVRLAAFGLRGESEAAGGGFLGHQRKVCQPELGGSGAPHRQTGLCLDRQFIILDGEDDELRCARAVDRSPVPDAKSRGGRR